MSLHYLRKKRISQALELFNDPFWNLNSLLIKGSSTAVNGGQNNTIIDGSTNNFTATRSGNVTQGNYSPYTSGGGSYYFDGTTDFVYFGGQTQFAFGTGDWKIELWVNLTTVASDSYIYDGRNIGQNDTQQLIFFTAATKNFVFYTGAAARITSTTVITPYTWNHVCVSRVGGVTRLFVNGVQEGSSYTDATNYTVGSTRPVIGLNGNNAAGGLSGYVSDLRVIKGSGVSASFALPTTPLTAVAGTQLLLNANNANLIDATRFNDLETYGASHISTSVTKFSKSLCFTGSNDSIVMRNTPINLVGNFTIEGWFYPTGTGANQTMFEFSGNGTYPAIRLYHDTGYNLAISTTGSSWAVQAMNIAPVSLNAWQHLAIVRQGGSIRLYKNGVLTYTNTSIAATTALMNGTVNMLGNYAIGNTINGYKGYMEDVRITKYVARYINDFTVNTSALPTALETNGGDLHYNHVTLHLHMNGSNGSTNFADQKGSSISVVGTPGTISTANSKFGGASYYVSNANGAHYITPSKAVINQTGPFTVEGWGYLTSYSGSNSAVLWSQYALGTSLSCAMQVNQSNKLSFFNNNGFTLTSSTNFPLNQWVHWALVRDSANVWTIYQDGVAVASATNTSGIEQSNFWIGNFNQPTQNHGWRGYIDEVRVTAYVARYASNFTVPAAPFSDYQDLTTDPYFKQSILLKTLRQGGNNTMLDSSPNAYAVTRVGNVAQGTMSPFSSSGFSVMFNGNNTVSIADNAAYYPGTGDFTVECWILPYNTSTGLIVTKRNSSSTAPFHLALTNGSIYVLCSTNGTSWDAINTTVPGVVKGEWNHVALVRSGNNTTLYLNGKGTLLRSTAWTPHNNSGLPLLFGADVAGGSGAFSGFLHGFRIVKGSAVYTGDFTPPQTKLTAIANTSILCFQDNRFVDQSTIGTTQFTLTSTPVIQAISPFQEAYSPATHGGSLLFDGTGDYLTVNGGANLSFGTGDFTADGWFYLSPSASNFLFLMSVASSGSTATGFQLYVTSGLKLEFNAASATRITGSTTIAKGCWYHFELSRSSGVTRMFLNGALEGSWTDTTNYSVGTNFPVIGADPALGQVWNGNIAMPRLIKGTALHTSAFAVPTTPSTAVANTQLLLSGTNAAVIDKAGKVVCETMGHAYGNVATRVYEGSVVFDGVTDYLSLIGTPAFGAADFTIEMWVNRNTSGVSGVLFDTRGAGTGPTNNHAVVFVSTGNLIQYLTGGTVPITGTTALQVGVWYHVAVCRYQGVTRAFVNGIQEGSSYTDSQTYLVGTNRPFIGGNGNNPATDNLNAKIEDVRITIGKGRYPTNFIPPTRGLPSL